MGVRSFQGISPVIGEKVMIDPSSVVIGKVTLGNDVSIWPQVVIRGDGQTITIGERSNIQDGVILHITAPNPHSPEGIPLRIGKEVTVGHGAILHACTVEDRVLIGMGAIVLDGAIIPSETLVAAGALVPPGKRLESGYIYAGNPARKSRELTAEEREFFSKSADNYVELKNKFLLEQDV